MPCGLQAYDTCGIFPRWVYVIVKPCPAGTPLAGAGDPAAPTMRRLGSEASDWAVRPRAKTITVSNNTSATVTFSSIAITGANAADFTQSGTTCGATLAPQASCTINIQFAPTATGARTASPTLADDASNSPQTVTLNGSGIYKKGGRDYRRAQALCVYLMWDGMCSMLAPAVKRPMRGGEGLPVERI
jgi:hypothetical protein